MKPADLYGHTLIVGPSARGIEGWTFYKDGKTTSVRVDGRFLLNGTEGAIAAAVAGLGIISGGLLGMLNELKSGQLVRILSEWEMGTADANVVLPAGRAAKPSARAFSNFIAAEFENYADAELAHLSLK